MRGASVIHTALCVIRYSYNKGVICISSMEVLPVCFGGGCVFPRRMCALEEDVCFKGGCTPVRILLMRPRKYVTNNQLLNNQLLLALI